MQSKPFQIGSCYGAMLPREEWANDFTEMRKAGLNVIRFGIGFPGRRGPRLRYWEDYDYIIELAEKNGIGVLLSLGTTSVPRSFFEKYPDIRFIDIDGQFFPRNIDDLTWPQACFNHPGYRSEIVQLYEMVIGRYKGSKAIHSWTVQNEPCNPWGGTGCFCKNTVAVFQGWLKERYKGNLDEVNRLWGTRFASWEDVQPPRKWPREGGNATAWMDWMAFGEWNVTDFVRWQAENVRRLDPSRPVGANTMGGMLLPITVAQSEKELGKVLDFVGQDWYPSWELDRRNGEKAQMEKHAAAKLDMIRWAVGEKPAIVMEVQAGPNAESIWFSRDEMRIEAWQTIAHGLKALYFYRWDPLISGAEPWVHHMRTVEGEITDRVDEAGCLSRQIQPMADLIAKSKPIRSPVALFYSRPSKIMAEADGLWNPQYDQATKGTYRLFTDNHYAVDWVDVDDVLAGKLGEYRVLLLPFICCLNEDVAGAIKAFVRAGGIVMAEPFCATRNDQGLPYAEVPGAGLAEMFGIKVTGAVNYRYWLIAHLLEMNGEGAALTGIKPTAKFWFCGVRQTVESVGAKVLAEFVEYPPLQVRAPAITVNEYGKGKAVYFAAGLGEAYTKMETPYLRQMIGGLLRAYGVEKPVEVSDMSDEASQDLEIMVLDAEGEADRTVVVINHASAPAQGWLRIKVREAGRLQVRELISFRSLPYTLEGDRLVVQADIPGREVGVYNIYKLV